MQTRESALHEWLKTIYPNQDYTLTPLAGDASFRRYYRLQQQLLSQIVMDSPPADLSLNPFIAVGQMLSKQGIVTPQIHAVDYASGFALLEDFGNMLFRDALDVHNPQELYQAAIVLLCDMQQKVTPPEHFGVFDHAYMLKELALFRDWFLERYLGLTLKDEEVQLLDRTFEQLTKNLLQQPQVLIHRDYHSRNIMLLQDGLQANHLKFGLIDFQDAMLGPITYDLVSLLKDCYIKLAPEQIQQCLHYFYDASPFTEHYPFSAFQRDFDWCGLQRHLKVLGIFCRLHFRDGKSNYLQDLALTFQYVMTCVEAYDEFKVFAEWLKDRVQEAFLSKNK